MNDRQKEKTRQTMLRIAELKIKAHGLKDTPEEYVKKATKKDK